MEKIRVAVIGYGNIGRYTIQALQAAPDMEIAGVVRRAGAEGKPAELAEYNVVKNIEEKRIFMDTYQKQSLHVLIKFLELYQDKIFSE